MSKLRVFSIQPKEVVDKLLDNGEVFVDEHKIANPEFIKAYDWLVKQMDKKLEHPNGVKYPWFCFYLLNKENNITYEDALELSNPDIDEYLLELEVEESDLFLTDYNKWHYVLNDCYFDNSFSEKEWTDNVEWFDSLPLGVQESVKLSSWNEVMNIKQYESDWCISGVDVQGTFWRLSKDMVTKMTFIPKEAK